MVFELYQTDSLTIFHLYFLMISIDLQSLQEEAVAKRDDPLSSTHGRRLAQLD